MAALTLALDRVPIPRAIARTERHRGLRQLGPAEHAILALGRLRESAVPRTAQDVANERARENYQRMIVRQEENLGMHAVDPAAVELRRHEEWCAAEVRDSAPRSIL